MEDALFYCSEDDAQSLANQLVRQEVLHELAQSHYGKFLVRLLARTLCYEEVGPHYGKYVVRWPGHCA
eukprot:4234741-Amphidinium_carterae.1